MDEVSDWPDVSVEAVSVEAVSPLAVSVDEVSVPSPCGSSLGGAARAWASGSGGSCEPGSGVAFVGSLKRPSRSAAVAAATSAPGRR